MKPYRSYNNNKKTHQVNNLLSHYFIRYKEIFGFSGLDQRHKTVRCALLKVSQRFGKNEMYPFLFLEQDAGERGLAARCQTQITVTIG